jgi:hypothetical protein
MTAMAQDVHGPYVAGGGIGSSSHAPTGSWGIATEDDDDDEDEQDEDND